MTQADVTEQADDFLAGQDGKQATLVFGADLRKDLPIIASAHFDEKQPRAGVRLADGLGLPKLLGFDVQDVVSQLRLGDVSRVGAAVLVDETHLPVIGMAGTRRAEMQSEKPCIFLHRGVRMRVVIERVALGKSCLRPVFGRQLLIARLVGFTGHQSLVLVAFVADDLGVGSAFHCTTSMT